MCLRASFSACMAPPPASAACSFFFSASRSSCPRRKTYQQLASQTDTSIKTLHVCHATARGHVTEQCGHVAGCLGTEGWDEAGSVRHLGVFELPFEGFELRVRALLACLPPRCLSTMHRSRKTRPRGRKSAGRHLHLAQLHLERGLLLARHTL